MGHAFQIKQFDRLPVLGAYLETSAPGQSQDGDPINLHASGPLGAPSQVRFLMRASGAPSPLLTAAATIVAATAGEVEYHWQAGETATAGYFQGEFEITWTASRLQTVPNHGYIPITVADDIA